MSSELDKLAQYFSRVNAPDLAAVCTLAANETRRRNLKTYVLTQPALTAVSGESSKEGEITDPIQAQRKIIETLRELAPVDSTSEVTIDSIIPTFNERVGKFLSDDLPLDIILIPSGYVPALAPEHSRLAKGIHKNMKVSFNRPMMPILNVGEIKTLGQFRQADPLSLQKIRNVGEGVLSLQQGFKK